MIEYLQIKFYFLKLQIVYLKQTKRFIYKNRNILSFEALKLKYSFLNSQ
jgi:hypothetical protein